MTYQYRNPPVNEAVCEVVFEPTDEWDITLPTRLFLELREDYPARPQELAVGPELPVVSVGGKNLKLRPPVARVMLYSEGRNHQVGISSASLSFHAVPPYGGWDLEMLPRVKKVLSKYSELDGGRTVQRIGVRYINLLPDSETPDDARKFVRLVPESVDGLPQKTLTYLSRLECAYPDGGKLLVGVGPAASDEKKRLVLDIDVVKEGLNVPFNTDQLITAIIDSKAKLNSAFELLITDEARSLFDA